MEATEGSRASEMHIARGDDAILVVDDEPSVVSALCDCLAAEGFDVVGKGTAGEALERLHAGRYSVLLTDLKLPDSDGIELVGASHELDPEMACIVMTGFGSIATAVKAMQAGAEDFIVKPIQLRVLRQAIDRALRVRALEREKADLQRQVRDRTLQLEQANRELEAFTHSVSHDLRQPIDVIAGFSDALLRKWDTLDERQRRHFVERVRSNAEHMHQLVADLLRLSQVSRAGMEKSVVKLSALATDIVAQLREEHAGRDISVDIQPGMTAVCDPGLLRIALENLLANAWKYTSNCAQPHIAVRSERIGENASECFVVEDNGAGFEMGRAADKLFEPFCRLHSSSEFPGTGIGLSIVRRIVERHGGHIWAQASPGKGATFRFTLGP